MAVTKHAAKATEKPTKVNLISVAVAKQTPTQTTAKVAKIPRENFLL